MRVNQSDLHYGCSPNVLWHGVLIGLFAWKWWIPLIALPLALLVGMILEMYAWPPLKRWLNKTFPTQIDWLKRAWWQIDYHLFC